jgi:hypothetical protein
MKKAKKLYDLKKYPVDKKDDIYDPLKDEEDEDEL